MSSFQLSQIRKGEGGEESAGNFWYPCDLVPVFSRPGQVGNIAPSKSALSVVMQLIYFVMINVYMEYQGFPLVKTL